MSHRGDINRTILSQIENYHCPFASPQSYGSTKITSKMARVRNANCNYERACAHDILCLAIFLLQFPFLSRSSVCATVSSPPPSSHLCSGFTCPSCFPSAASVRKKLRRHVCTRVPAFIKSLRFSTYTRRFSFFFFFWKAISSTILANSEISPRSTISRLLRTSR